MLINCFNCCCTIMYDFVSETKSRPTKITIPNNFDEPKHVHWTLNIVLIYEIHSFDLPSLPSMCKVLFSQHASSSVKRESSLMDEIVNLSTRCIHCSCVVCFESSPIGQNLYRFEKCLRILIIFHGKTKTFFFFIFNWPKVVCVKISDIAYCLHGKNATR